MTTHDIQGEVLTPHDPAYDEARKVWNGMVDVRPAVIVRCEGSDDVAKAVRLGIERGGPVSIRAGGHNVAGTAVVDDGVVIDLSRMNEVEVDPEKRIARVGGGATLGDVDRATFQHGLVTPSGFVSQTGIGGLSLRGGLGHTMRRFGLSCDNIEAVELVTSDGELRRVTEDTDADLLWALRGGPLDLGVVTRFDFRLHPIGPEVRFLLCAFPADKGIDINRFMAAYMEGAPREVGLVSFYVTLPDHEEIPEPVRGSETIVLFGMYTGERAEAEDVLAPILEHPDLLADLGGWMPYPDAQSAMDGDYPDGLRYYWKSLYLDELTDETLEVLHRHGRERPSPASTLDLWTMGGSIADVDPGHAAFPQRHARYMIAIEANWEDPSDDEANIAWARRTAEALEPHSNGAIYMNFAGSREEYQEAQGQRMPSLDRLLEIQERVDPSGVFAGPWAGREQEAR